MINWGTEYALFLPRLPKMRSKKVHITKNVWAANAVYSSVVLQNIKNPCESRIVGWIWKRTEYRRLNKKDYCANYLGADNIRSFQRLQA